MIFKKKEEEEEPLKPKKKEEENEQEWDKKRILITLFVIIAGLVILFEVKDTLIKNKTVLGDAVQNKPVEIKKPDVQSPKFDVSSKVGAKIEDIKKNVSTLDPAEVASSSPQVQKVLRDIQGIKDLPADQAKQSCMKICSGI